jgi:hypothetical protein
LVQNVASTELLPNLTCLRLWTSWVDWIASYNGFCGEQGRTLGGKMQIRYRNAHYTDFDTRMERTSVVILIPNTTYDASKG